MRRAAILFVSLALLCVAPAKLWSRIEVPPYAVDLATFVSSAPVIFRATVLDVSDVAKEPDGFTTVAHLRVDRWYRGGSSPSVAVEYQEGLHLMGHDCISLKSDGTEWLIFAREQKGHLEFVDDCYAAVRVSPLLGSPSPRQDTLAQIEADFEAGLSDPEPAGRLLSIQGLGCLMSASSRPALHRIIDQGDPAEKDWATYAALRSGDVTVLPRVREMFARGGTEINPVLLAWELSQLTDRSGIPVLIEIAATSPDPHARGDALDALGRKMHAPEALPVIVDRLSDTDPGVRFSALAAMDSITHVNSCKTQPTDDLVRPQIRQCVGWWDEAGKKLFTGNPK